MSAGNAAPDALTELHRAVEHYQFGRLVQAEEICQQVLQKMPHHADILHLLGCIHIQQGKHEIGIDLIGKAIHAEPGRGNYYFSLGNVLHVEGRLEEAVASYRQTLLLKPDFAEAYSNLGNVLQDQGRLDESIACYRQALLLKPDYAEAYCNLGTSFLAQDRLDDASVNFRQALLLRPDLAEAHCNLGNTLKAQGHLGESIACYRQALLLKPNYAEAYNNLGNVLNAQGRLDESVACYRQALLLNPDFSGVHSNLLYCLNYHPDKSAEEIFAEYRDYEAHFAEPYRPTWRPHRNHRNVQRRLKIGYVSPDFRLHSVRHFLEPVLAHHDKSQVEIYAYAELMREDDVTTRYKGYVDHWIPTAGQSDEALAERIRADGIDILVDLAGHTEKNRLQVFARKPAPISVTWLGYAYTTGLNAIDYILTDSTSAPPGSERLFSETPWRLAPPCYVYRPAEGMGSVSPLPALTCGQVTFGTLTRSVRINHRVVRVWSEILKQVPGSRLMLDSSSFRDEGVQTMLAGQFAAHGVPRDRLAFGCHSPPWDVLREMDIGLDCFPHNSGTTLLETLYLGVPYVTLLGRPSVGRLGSAFLEGAGHPEWIARTEEEYIEKAVKLASDLPALSKIRSQLREEMNASRLMDEAGFTHQIEAAYREMFAAWSAKQG